MHLIQQAFGEYCSLYKDVLQCPEDVDAAGLRKAYYRRALKYHPDKQQDDKEKATLCFQAISAAYQILQDAELRAVYDETKEIPDKHDDDADAQGMEQWKNYFAQIFGKVTASDIDAFASKYKCSDEEKRDVLKEFRKQSGDLVKMLDFVMLSEARDAARWVEDYIKPALEPGGDLEEMASSAQTTMEKSLKKLQKQIEKENKDMTTNEAELPDPEETDSEDDLPPVIRMKSKKKASKPSPKKGKPTKAKKSKEGDMSDLIAKIQNKNRGGGANLLSNLGRRYGVDMDGGDDGQDPLNDDEFAKIQARLEKNRKK